MYQNVGDLVPGSLAESLPSHVTMCDLRILCGSGLKALAVAAMLVDHIVAFLTVEGFVHTHDRFLYERNLLLFALLSELPFNLVNAM